MNRLSISGALAVAALAITALALTTLAAPGGAESRPNGAGEESALARPSEDQAKWQDLEVGMFCHFSINTFNNLE